MKPLTQAYYCLMEEGNRNLAWVIEALQDCGGEDITGEQAQEIVGAILRTLGAVKFPPTCPECESDNRRPRRTCSNPWHNLEES